MARKGVVTIPAMREDRAETAPAPVQFDAAGLPQSQHAVEAELIDRLGDAGLLDLPRDRAQAERIEA